MKVRWWERMVNCSSALWTVWSTLLTYPLREDVKEPSDIFLGANVMKFSYEKPHEMYKGRTHLMWVAQWSIRDIRFKCLLSFCIGTGIEMWMREQRSPTYIQPTSLFWIYEEWKLKRQSVKTVCETSAEEMACLTWQQLALLRKTRFDIALENLTCDHTLS